ncbi:MAG TPA: GNAT family N-acetyltransferase [Syntrophorhabdaceae bacterium]|nr:GNAT family N-acetyltransferase [Syntrophorhabdaceae bacterium]
MVSGISALRDYEASSPNEQGGTVCLIEPSKDMRWDAFVESHPLGWISQLSDWGNILEECFKHIKGYYIAILDEDDHIQAGLPIYSVKSHITGNRMVSVPHATLCDPLVDNAVQLRQLTDAVVQLSHSLGISKIEIKSFMSGRLFKDMDFDEDTFYKHHYLQLMPDPEQLKKSFHRTCIRQRIARAFTSNFVVKIADKVSDLLDFYKLHTMTRRRHGLPPQPFQFFELMWRRFYPKRRLALLTAFHGSLPAASMIILKFRNRVSAEFAASDQRFFNLSPNHLVFWEAIKMACFEKFEIFDFGRTSPTNQELMDFKRRWGTSIMELPQFYYPRKKGVRTKREDRYTYKCVQAICQNLPISMLPGVGRLLYNHLG